MEATGASSSPELIVDGLIGWDFFRIPLPSKFCKEFLGRNALAMPQQV
jgi:hypothetical protein